MDLIKRQYTIQGICFRDANDGDNGVGVVSGKAIVFNSPSQFMWLDDPTANEREVILPQAVTKEFLDTQDILLTVFHDPEKILGRSSYGQGTLKYRVETDAVYFDCQLPNTQHGHEVRELIKRGDISECSFVFTTPYFDKEYVEPKLERDEAGNEITTFYVKKLTGVYDFTVCPRGAYGATSCSARNEQTDKLNEYIKRSAQELKENSDKDNMTDEQFNTLVERICDAVKKKLVPGGGNADPEPQAEPEPQGGDNQDPQGGSDPEPEPQGGDAQDPQGGDAQDPQGGDGGDSDGEGERKRAFNASIDELNRILGMY